MAIVVGPLLLGCTPDNKPAVAKPPPKRPDHGPVSKYNLPLIIHIEPPPVPPEIEKPSPPIKSDTKKTR